MQVRKELASTLVWKHVQANFYVSDSFETLRIPVRSWKEDEAY